MPHNLGLSPWIYEKHMEFFRYPSLTALNAVEKSTLQPNFSFPMKKTFVSHLHPIICSRRHWRYRLIIPVSVCPFSDQILEALARNDDMLVQMCGRLSSSCDVIPEELQVRFSTMCGERVEHINRRITNYRKVTVLSCSDDK